LYCFVGFVLLYFLHLFYFLLDICSFSALSRKCIASGLLELLRMMSVSMGFLFMLYSSLFNFLRVVLSFSFYIINFNFGFITLHLLKVFSISVIYAFTTTTTSSALFVISKYFFVIRYCRSDLQVLI
jgi:hypothetical protein